MGKISKKGDVITVEFTGEEIVAERAMVSLPQAPPPGAKYAWWDWIGSFIARAAWRKIIENTNHLKGKKYGSVIVTVTGPVTIIFEDVKENT